MRWAQADSTLDVNELALSADVNYRSLATPLPKFFRWHYLKRHTGYNFQDRPCFVYTLATKGRRWLDKHNGDFSESDIRDNAAIVLRNGTRLYRGTREYDTFLARLKVKRPTRILRWYELNSDAWVKLKLENNRLYFTVLLSEPAQYVCRNVLSVNDVPMAWLQIYGDNISMLAIRQAYQAYRRGLRSGNNQGVEL